MWHILNDFLISSHVRVKCKIIKDMFCVTTFNILFMSASTSSHNKSENICILNIQTYTYTHTHLILMYN